MDDVNVANVKVEPFSDSFPNNKINHQVNLIPKIDVKKEIEDSSHLEYIPMVSEDIKIEIEETDIKKECFGDANEDFREYKYQEEGSLVSEIKSESDVGNEESLVEEGVPEENSPGVPEEKKRVYIRKKSHTCDVCNKIFTQRSTLITHQRVHTGENPYTCNVCQKSFKNNSNLTNHKRIHTGEKPYSCDVCEKLFSTKSNLNIHRRRHTGEKLYSCDECNKRFSSKSYLVRHKYIHTDVKPNTCDAVECPCNSFT